MAAGDYKPIYRGEIDVEGQINLEEWKQSINHKVYAGCTGCICRRCLYWWSSRCPYGECWDDHRAIIDPYDKAHPDQPLRTAWSNWNKPGEQAYWCRGGENYPIHYCKHFVKYKGQQVKTCLKANVSIFQDGYISCSIIDSVGCGKCYEEFERRQE